MYTKEKKAAAHKFVFGRAIEAVWPVFGRRIKAVNKRPLHE
jgi:hypothetical protein